MRRRKRRRKGRRRRTGGGAPAAAAMASRGRGTTLYSLSSKTISCSLLPTASKADPAMLAIAWSASVSGCTAAWTTSAVASVAASVAL